MRSQLLNMDWKYQYQILRLIGEENESKFDEIVKNIMNGNPYKHKEKIKDIIRSQLLNMDWKYQYQILRWIGEENESKYDEIVKNIMNL